MKQCGKRLRGALIIKKRKTKRLRELDVVNADRISELPEDLILKILSLLPTKDVIATSVLSKQWRSLWKMVPKLVFISDNKEFAENVSRSLLSHKAPVLESFNLTVRHVCDDKDVGLWARIAIARNVREFVLQSVTIGHSVKCPNSLFFCDTLETLELGFHSIYVDIPCPVSMKSLRTLHLEFVGFKDNESIRNLLSGCPNLEDLLVSRCTTYKYVRNFIFVAPSLKRLSIYESSGRKSCSYMINAPSLRYLQIGGLNGYEFFLIENASQLEEANLSNISDEKILGSLKSVKRLCLGLSPLEITYPTGVIFYQLVSLEMCTRKEEWWNLLTLMLDSSPKLQVLKLTDRYDGFKDGWLGGKWKYPKCVPECLMSHLETFVWKKYDWRREEEKQVATYILRNARRLNKATFSTRPIKSKRKRLEMVNELNSVVRASNSCHLVFE